MRHVTAFVLLSCVIVMGTAVPKIAVAEEVASTETTIEAAAYGPNAYRPPPYRAAPWQRPYQAYQPNAWRYPNWRDSDWRHPNWRNGTRAASAPSTSWIARQRYPAAYPRPPYVTRSYAERQAIMAGTWRARRW